jgi:uncharacterized protein
MRILGLAVCILGLSALNVNAQVRETPASSPPSTVQQTGQAPPAQTEEKKIDPQKEADIRKLLDLMGTTGLMQQILQNSEKSLRPLMANALPAGEYRDKLLDLFFAKFQSELKTQSLIDLAVPVYDKYFSDEDIKGMIQFYQTPLGQKAVKTMPQLMNELSQAGRKMGEDIGRRSMLEVMAEHPELEKAMEDAGKANHP